MRKTNLEAQQPFLSSFARNRGRSLRPYQQSLVEELLPTLAVDVAEIAKITSGVQWHSTGAPAANSSDHRSVALEIGFGAGEHLRAQAAHNPDTLFIGCEPYINGVAKCLSGIAASKLTNISLFTDDARKLLQALPDGSIDSAFILFPDPWPKLRHNKRRLVNHETLAMLARVQKPGARLLLATDHVDYSVWMFELLLTTPHYRWTARACADWENPPADWTQTKYQRKTTEQGRLPVFIECVRN